MLPRKLHLEQINRFHDKIDAVRKEIEKTIGRDDLIEHNHTLCKNFFELTELWFKIDNICEMDIKNFIDIMES